jgi:branched-chain amino acid transport system permease protein
MKKSGLFRATGGRFLSRNLPDGKWSVAELLLWTTPLVVLFAFPGYLVLGSQIFVAALFALSLDLILGYAGIVSLGHAASFGVGAYTAGLLSVHGWGEPISGLFLGGLMAAAVGCLTSLLLVRLGELSRLMVTLGICLVLFEIANKASAVTGGGDGLSGMQMWKILGLFEFDISGRVAYLYSFSVLFVIFIFLRRLTSSPFGLSLRGIKQGIRRMPSLGTPVSQRLVLVYTLGAGIAGIAGALLAQTTQFVGLDSLGFQRSADVLVMLMLGGVGSLYGALAGSVVFIVAQSFLSSLNPIYWEFWLGLMLVLLVAFAKGGIAGTLHRVFVRLRNAKDGAAP